MELTFNRPHLSISHFEPYNLPTFTLITGLNGSGKTHFLQAVMQGAIRVDDHAPVNAPNKGEISFYDYKTLVPNNSEKANSGNILPYQSVIKNINELKNSIFQQDKALFSQARVEYSNNFFDSKLLKLTSDFKSSGLSESQKEKLSIQVESLIKQSIVRTRSSIENTMSVSHLSDVELLEIDFDNIYHIPLKNSSDSIFKQSFSNLFLKYHELVKYNKILRLDYENGGKKVPLSDDEFIAKHKEPPWEIINKTLAGANLDFYLTYPEEYLITEFVPKLIKKSTEQEVNFNTLSSGEKILMSFAFCLFYSTDDSHTVQTPKVLLLDEVDASLHPSMAKQLLDVVYENLVMKQGIKVIMTTHSPSTVAMAPEDSVYVKHSGNSKLCKSSKDEAINILTSGIPTLSIDISGRKQVFVESKNDEARYSEIYNILKPKLNSPFSLNFIAMGSKKSTGEDLDSGCGRVIKMVKSLRDAENYNVFGLVDWDKKPNRTSNNSIQVLGQGKWHSIENCILDPLVLLTTILRRARGFAKNFGLPETVCYTNILDADRHVIQQAVDKLQSVVLGKNITGENTEKTQFDYLDGISLMISNDYAQYRGHDLADLVVENIQVFNNYQNQVDNLLSIIIRDIFTEQLGCIPVALVDDFRELLDK